MINVTADTDCAAEIERLQTHVVKLLARTTQLEITRDAWMKIADEYRSEAVLAKIKIAALREAQAVKGENTCSQ